MRALVPVAVLAVLAGCGPLSQLASTKLAVGTVLATPRLVDSSGNTVAKPIVVADVFYGERQNGVVSTTPPTGIPGATVTEHVFDDVANTVKDVPLDDQQNGHYQADSSTTPDLGPYDPQAEYRTDITDDKPSPYVCDASQVPAPETPQGVPSTQPVQVDLTVSRTGADTAFVSVVRFGATAPVETWTNRPKTPLDVLAAVADPTAFQAASFTIPGNQAFPTAGTYAVILTTVTRAVPGPSLDPTSGVFVGAGSAATLKVQ